MILAKSLRLFKKGLDSYKGQWEPEKPRRRLERVESGATPCLEHMALQPDYGLREEHGAGRGYVDVAPQPVSDMGACADGNLQPDHCLRASPRLSQYSVRRQYSAVIDSTSV